MRVNIFILTILFSATFVFGQTEERINTIRKKVEKINTDTTFIAKTLDNDQWMEQKTDGGGQLTAYFKNGEVVKIVKLVGLSSCVSVCDYYLQNNCLIFVYGKENVFKYDEKTNTFDSKSQKISTESRYYFDHEKLLKLKFSGQPKCGDVPSDIDAKNLLADSKNYLKLFTK